MNTNPITHLEAEVFFQMDIPDFVCGWVFRELQSQEPRNFRAISPASVRRIQRIALSVPKTFHAHSMALELPSPPTSSKIGLAVTFQEDFEDLAYVCVTLVRRGRPKPRYYFDVSPASLSRLARIQNAILAPFAPDSDHGTMQGSLEEVVW